MTLQFPEAIPGATTTTTTTTEPEKTSKAEALADLRTRYEKGEGPQDDLKERVREPKKLRSKKELELEAERFERFAGSLTLLSQVASEMICSQLPNPLPPTSLEVEVLNKSLSGVAEKHFDKLLEYDAEASLLIVVLAIVLPRLKKDKITERVDTISRNMEEASKAAEALEKELEAKRLEAEKNKKPEGSNAT